MEIEVQYQAYDIVDKGKVAKSMYFNMNDHLSSIADSILQQPQWSGCTLVFFDANGAQFPKAAEGKVTLRKFYPQKKINIKTAPLASNRTIKFIERKTNETTSILINTNLMLKQAKLFLKGKYKDVAFYLIDSAGAASKLSEQSQKETPISYVIKKQTIQYEGFQKQLTPQENSKQQEEKKQKSIQNAKKTREQVNQLLTDLDNYSKKQKAKTKQQQKQREEILNKISTKLNQLGVNFKKDNFDTSKVIGQLTSIKKESQSFIGRLTASKQPTPSQMVSRFPNLICKRYFMNKQVASLQHIIDFNHSKFQITSQSVGISSKQLSYSDKSSFQSFQKKFKQQSSGVSVETVVSTPMFFVKAGVDAQQSSIKKSANLTTQTHQTFTQLYFAIYKGKGVLITQQSIKLKEEIIQKYNKYLENFKNIMNQLKGKEGGKQFVQLEDQIKLLQPKIIDFFKNYGYEIDLGNYIFGNIFMLKNSLTYDAKEQFSEVQQVAQKSLSASVSGGYGMFAASVRANTSSGSGESSGTTQKKSKITQVSQLFSNPPVNNLNQWKQIMVFCPEYWNLLDTSIKRWPLYDILINSLNKCEDNQYFHDFLDQTYSKFADKSVESQVTSQLRIALVGPSGSGKSTFANILVGEYIDKPFGVSNGSKSMTDQVQTHRKGNQIYYDTPGFGDNTQKFKPGELDRMITDQLIRENSKNGLASFQAKKINAFLIVTKPNPRIDLEASLNYMRKMFGQKCIQTSIFIFNYRSKEERSQTEQVIMDTLIINLKNIFPKYENLLKNNLRDRVYFNYYPKLDQDSKYRSYQKAYKKQQLLIKIQKLKATPYTSALYTRYQKQLEEENKKKEQMKQNELEKIRKQYAQKQKALERNEIVTRIRKQLERITSFTLKDNNTNKYIKYGCIYNDQFLGMGQKGFTTGGWQRLYLDKISVDVQNHTISGQLCSRQKNNRYACQNGNLMIGYRTPEMNQDRVVIRFKDQFDMDSFSGPQRLVFVTIGFQYDQGRCFYDDNGQLKRGNEKRLFQLVPV